MKRIYLSVALASLICSSASAQIINNFAGDATGAGSMTGSYSGDGAQATTAGLNRPYGIAIDASGNVYIAEYNNQRVRKVTPAGIISTYAGNGTAGYSGDGTAATGAMIKNPYGLAVDATGNLYIADAGNSVIRKVTPAGIISTFAGVTAWGFSGDGGPATAAQFSLPTGVAVDGAGNVYICDGGNNRIRKVNASGVINTVVGSGTTGFGGDGGPASAAQLGHPYALEVDGPGNIYIADNDNYRIRKVNTSGIIMTIVGNGTNGHAGDGGAATACQMKGAMDIALDAAGNLYFSEWGWNVRVVNTAGTISNYAGTTTYGYSGDGGPATLAKLNEPRGLAVDASSNLYLTDDLNHVVRRISPSPSLGLAGQVAPASMSVYPNPAGTYFSVDATSVPGAVEISVTDVMGRVVLARTVSGNGAIHEEFSTLNLANGTYFVRIDATGWSLSDKIVVAR